MKLFIPNIYYSNIYEVDYIRLKKDGIKCLLFDLDNTCVGYHDKKPTSKLKELFNYLNKKGFRVVIFSNTTKKRIRAFEGLGVICHPMSRKPLSGSFKRLMKEYGYLGNEVCIIGDQLFTDVLGGNRVHIVTCLVDPITNEDFFVTRFFRIFEKRILKKIKNNYLEK